MKKNTVLIVGASGKLGSHLVNEALARGVHVRTLGRTVINNTEHVSGNIAVMTSDDLRSAVHGVDAVISAVQGGPDVILQGQKNLLVAAAASGVRRFVPSTFSFDVFRLPAGLNMGSDWRRQFGEMARTNRGGTEVVHVIQGIFADRGVMSFMELVDFERRCVNVWGGDVPISFTSLADTAAFTLEVALDEQTVPETAATASEVLTPVELAQALGMATQSEFSVVHRGSIADLDAEIAKRQKEQPQNFFAWVGLTYTRALASGLVNPGDLRRYQSLHPSKVSAAMAV